MSRIYSHTLTVSELAELASDIETMDDLADDDLVTVYSPVSGSVFVALPESPEVAIGALSAREGRDVAEWCTRRDMERK